MSLLEKLKNDRDACVERYKRLEKNLEVCKRELEKCDADWADFNVAIAALEPAPVAEPETQTGEGVEIPEGFTKWESGYCPFEIGTHVEILTRKCGVWPVTIKPEAPLLWEHENHDTDIIAYRIIEPAPTPEDEPDNASEFAEPDDEAQRAAAIELTADVEPIPQPEWNEPQPTEAIGYFISEGQSVELRSDGSVVPLQPTEGYAPVTNPEADEQAKLREWYDPKAVADRNRFNPFGMFKRETEEVS